MVQISHTNNKLQDGTTDKLKGEQQGKYIFFLKKKRKEKETSTACAQVTAYLNECQDLGFPLGL